MKKTTLFFLLTAFTCISFAQQITLIDFGLSDPDRTTAGNWNNVTNSSTLSSFTDLFDNSGLSTGEILTLTDAFDDAIKSAWYINDEEYDYICEKATDEELDLFLGGDGGFSNMKKALATVDNLIDEMYNSL